MLNLSSGAGLWGVPGMAGYSTAKMGIVGLTRALAQEGAAHGIARERDGAERQDAARRLRADPGVAPAPRLALARRRRRGRRLARARAVHGDGECFTVGGGYVGRVMVAVNDG